MASYAQIEYFLKPSLEYHAFTLVSAFKILTLFSSFLFSVFI